MRNKRVRRRFTDKLYFLFVFLIVAGGLMVAGKGLIRAFEIPVVYMVHGDKNTCIKATDAQGNPITCEEAMKDGRYHIEWNAPPKTLNEN